MPGCACPAGEPLTAGIIFEKDDVILGFFGEETLFDSVAAEFGGEGAEGSVGGFGLEVVTDSAKVMFIFVWVFAVIFPVVPNGERNIVEEIGNLLADEECSLSFG